MNTHTVPDMHRWRWIASCVDGFKESPLACHVTEKRKREMDNHIKED